MREIENIVALYHLLAAEGTPCALATVVDIAGSSYRRIGARMLVAADGRFAGGISGGCLEGDALKRAKLAILNDRPSVQVYDTLEDDDRAIGVGLGCNGRIDVLFSPVEYSDDRNDVLLLSRLPDLGWETVLYRLIGGPGWLENTRLLDHPPPAYPEVGELATAVRHERKSRVVEVAEHRVLLEYVWPKFHLYVVGDNYDVHSLIALISQMGWAYSLVGKPGRFTRPEAEGARSVLTPERFGRAELSLGAPYPAVILMTHDFALDKQLLPLLFAKDPAYVGVLGPRKRMDRLRSELTESGQWPAADPDCLHAPIGLDLGANTPEEIALAVAAEVLAKFRGRAGGVLREGVGGLH